MLAFPNILGVKGQKNTRSQCDYHLLTGVREVKDFCWLNLCLVVVSPRCTEIKLITMQTQKQQLLQMFNVSKKVFFLLRPCDFVGEQEERVKHALLLYEIIRLWYVCARDTCNMQERVDRATTPGSQPAEYVYEPAVGQTFHPNEVIVGRPLNASTSPRRSKTRKPTLWLFIVLSPADSPHTMRNGSILWLLSLET